jgi:hypothetical protein
MEGFPQLLHDPGTIWMSGKVPVQNAPPVMRDDEEAVKNAKGQHRYGEEFHRGDGFAMIAPEPGSSDCRFGTTRRFPHRAQDDRFRSIEAKHRKFAVYAWSAPGLGSRRPYER